MVRLGVVKRNQVKTKKKIPIFNLIYKTSHKIELSADLYIFWQILQSFYRSGTGGHI